MITQSLKQSIGNHVVCQMVAPLRQNLENNMSAITGTFCFIIELAPLLQ